MTLPETLLPRLSEWRPAGAGRHSWAESFPDAGWTVQIAADKTDSLSCLVWEMTLNRTADVPAGLTLSTWAAGIASRVAGLMEQLKVHEVDQHRGEAILRSVAPAKKGDALAYYEVRLPNLNTAVVRRFTASKVESGRDQVPFALTHETIAKIVGDIAG
ncbi:MAG: hypothetical protein C0467_06760 [Planctomycetaceae bacterium]|nr:hypothetical protein [Planctomycetaceae bacterium]